MKQAIKEMRNRGYRGLWKNEKARVLREKWKKENVNG